MKKIMLTGDRPTGRLHLGHYVGSLKKYTPCTSVVYVVRLIYKFAKGLIILEYLGILHMKVATKTTQV